MNEYILPFLSLFLQMAPYLLLGFMIAGMLHAFVPTNVYRLSAEDLSAKDLVLRTFERRTEVEGFSTKN